jgi:predicted permease
VRDLKFAFRTLFKTPFVTAVAVLSLGLGIGANSAIFSLFNQLLLRSLPVPAAGELVSLGAPGPKNGSNSCNQAGDCDLVFSYPMFRDLEREQQVFTGIAAHRIFSANIGYRNETLSDEGVQVSGSYFGVLGLKPVIGRLIAANDDARIGESAVVVLSHEYWRRRFSEDPQILGQTLVVNGQHLSVIGVAPKGFEGTTKGSRPKIFVPITLRGTMEAPFAAFENRTSYWAYLFARLKPGVSIDQARTGINVPYRALINNVEVPLQTGLSPATLEQFKQKTVSVEDGRRGQSSIYEEAGTPLQLLLGVTVIVLLIACANIANLLLARSAARAGEVAVRLSIGASRGQLIRQFLIESVALAFMGGLAGLLFNQWTMAFILALLPAEAAETIISAIDLPILLFTGALAIATGLLFGLFPAIHSSRPDLASTLKGQAGSQSGARSATFFRQLLVTFQIALSMCLLASAGLFVKSLGNVSRVDLGLQIDRVVTFTIAPSRNGYTPAQSLDLFRRVEESLAAMPGVEAVGGARVPVLAGSNSSNGISVEGFHVDADTNSSSNYNEIAPGYFKTFGVPLVAGREFTAADTLGAPSVAIVNEAFTRKFRLGRDAVGKRMTRRGRNLTSDFDIEIVGVVKDAKYSEVRQTVPSVFFTPYRQNDRLGVLTFYVRTATDPVQFLRTLTPTVAALAPNLPVEELRTMPQQVRQNVFLDRMISILTVSFASLATVLAAIGLYGVLAFTVAQRTREFGLRMALGADARRVRRMVMKQVVIMTLIGGVVGLACAVAVGRFAGANLFEMTSYDPVVLATSSAILAVVALGAGLLPAVRASRINPLRALRYE